MKRRYAMNFDSRELPQEHTDCLIIGGGVAGLMTAWYVANEGLDVTLIVRDTLLDSNTNKAQGGIAVAFGQSDSLDLHVKDTLVAGAGLCDEAVVRLVVSEGREAVRQLMDLGAIFDTDENGLCLGREGCHSVNRVIHAKGDATGAEVVRALLAAVKKLPNIRLLEDQYAVDLLTNDGSAGGALVLHKGERLKIIRSFATVLATGGVGRLYCHTTNPGGATASGIALAYRAGAQVMDMEFVQFHPTALAMDGVPNFLISEAVRGAGGILKNARGQRFMPQYHAMAELAPRDVVARAIYRELHAADGGPVYLDVAPIADFGKHFPTISAACLSYGLDLARDMIPVAPAAHYMMGGVRVDMYGESSIKGLYACGEAACTGLHGANRLASNSLLEGLAFGKRIAKAAAARRKIVDDNIWWQCGELRAGGLKLCGRYEKIQETMTNFLGLVRNQNGLLNAQNFFEAREEELQETEMKTIEQMEYLNMLTAGSLISLAAVMRCESRGGHFRSDFPESRMVWQKHIMQQL